MKTTSIISHTDSQEYYFKEGCHILEIINTCDDPDVSVARARVEPGVRTVTHQLANTCERYVILAGIGDVSVGPLRQHVGPGDSVLIPQDCPQSIRNIGTEDLVFLAICSPRFKPENYRESCNESENAGGGHD